MSEQENNPSRPALPVPVVFIALLALAVGIYVSMKLFKSAAKTKSPALVSGTWLHPAKNLSDFSLIKHDKTPFSANSLKGQWSLLFFGYTHCPDVCPNTLTVLNLFALQLGRHKELIGNTRIVFVSVDPKRDTPDHLAKYVKYFNKAFMGLTGKMSEIRKLTTQLGVLHDFVQKKSDKDYHVSHSAYIILINPEGRVQAVFSEPHKVRNLYRNYLNIRQHARK